jgi:hypothetical protein
LLSAGAANAGAAISMRRTATNILFIGYLHIRCDRLGLGILSRP